MTVWCPYKDCGFDGTEEEVDDHRATGVHNDQPQAGSNLKHNPERATLAQREAEHRERVMKRP